MQESARLIGEALLKLADHKEFAKITITDIQRESYVGRATFYRLFDTTDDVLAYLCDRTMDRILIRQHDLNNTDTRSVCQFFIEQWIDESRLLQLVADSGHMDILYRSFRTLVKEGGHDFFPNAKVTAEQEEYIIAIAASALVGGLDAWIRHGRKESAAEVLAIVVSTVEAIHTMLGN